MLNHLLKLLITSVCLAVSISAHTAPADMPTTYDKSVSVSRYLNVTPEVPVHQLWTLEAVISFSTKDFATIREAVLALIGQAGYRLHHSSDVDPFNSILSLPVPSVHAQFDNNHIHQIVHALMGPAIIVVIDPVSRFVTFEVDEQYKAFIQ